MKNEKRVIIGGEKVFPLSIFFLKNKNDIFNDYKKEFKDFNINYTFGGYCSLLAIIDDINFKENETVLLPSYLCSSILRPFDARRVKYDFYKIDNNLTPDIHHIKQCLNGTTKGIVFIDYMGKSQIDNVMLCKDMLSKQGVKIIQDCVQTININTNQVYGDYVFNSFRKTTPFEGSVILSKTKMKIAYARGIHYKFIFYKRIGQILRYYHLHYNYFKPELFLSFIEKAEIEYQDAKIHNLPSINKALIRKIDFKKLSENHLTNYNILLKQFKDFVPESLRNVDFKPFGFFMLVKDRDRVRAELHKNGIFCPIHWILPDEINKDHFKESAKMAAMEITMPLGDLDATNLNNFLTTIERAMT